MRSVSGRIDKQERWFMRASHFVLGVLAALALTACDRTGASRPPVDSVRDADMSGRDSTLVSGEMPTGVARSSGDVTLPESHPSSSDVASSTSVEPASTEIVLPEGTMIAVRIDRSLSTTRSRAGNAFHALLDAPLFVDGKRVLPRGTRFTGHVTTSESSGRLKGRAELAITLDAIDVDGRRYPISTSVSTRRGAAHARRNLTFIGGGGGIGALVGGLSGGKTGVAIGTAVGAGVGTAIAASSGKQDLAVPAQQLYRFSLERSVRLPG